MPTAQLHVVIPAAGAGKRMAGETPKQYLPIAGKSVLEWSLAQFLARADIARVVVVLPPNDDTFARLAVATHPLIRTAKGGSERVDSVLAGVRALQANDSDWVLVHDAARPCLHADDLSQLITELSHSESGGLLACPVSDTLKSADGSQCVRDTVPRDHLWRALTPQMFRFGVLQRALVAAHERGSTVTDESAAVEALGLKPKLVRGRADNIKITVPEDLAYAEHILRQREI